MSFDTTAAARPIEPHSAIVRLAAAYAAGTLPRDEANAFEDRVRTELRFRQIALGRLAIEHLPEPLVAGATRDLGADSGALDHARSQALTRLTCDVQLAFEARFPTFEQLELRDQVWSDSPYRAAFPGINVVTMESHRNGLRLVKRL